MGSSEDLGINLYFDHYLSPPYPTFAADEYGNDPYVQEDLDEFPPMRLPYTKYRAHRMRDMAHIMDIYNIGPLANWESLSDLWRPVNRHYWAKNFLKIYDLRSNEVFPVEWSFILLAARWGDAVLEGIAMDDAKSIFAKLSRPMYHSTWRSYFSTQRIRECILGPDITAAATDNHPTLPSRPVKQFVNYHPHAQPDVSLESLKIAAPYFTREIGEETEEDIDMYQEAERTLERLATTLRITDPHPERLEHIEQSFFELVDDMDLAVTDRCCAICQETMYTHENDRQISVQTIDELPDSIMNLWSRKSAINSFWLLQDRRDVTIDTCDEYMVFDEYEDYRSNLVTRIMKAEIAAAPPGTVPDFKECNRIIVTVCGHAFDAKCLTKWLLKRTSCPTCRHKLIDPEADLDLDESPLVTLRFRE
jgi:hypothetical protein